MFFFSFGDRRTSSFEQRMQSAVRHLRRAQGVAAGQIYPGLAIDRELKFVANARGELATLFDHPVYSQETPGRCLVVIGSPSGWTPDLAEEIWSAGLERSAAKLKGRFLAFEWTLDRVTILSDKWGLEPGFIFRADGSTFCCSIPAPLIEMAGDQIDRAAVDDFATLGIVLNDRTFHPEVKNLPAGSLTVLENGRCVVSYPFAAHEEPRAMSLAEAADGFWEALRSGVKREIASGVSHAFITGGADSRLLAAAMSEEDRTKVDFVTVDRPAYSNDDWDMRLAEQLAARHRFRHRLVQPLEGARSVARPVVEPASRYRRIEVPILGGMYGTELIGMGILLSLPFSFTAYRMDQEMWMREKLFGTVFARSRSPFAELQSSIQELSAGSKEWTGLAPYFWRSFINATHIEAGTYTMTFPYMNALSNKRLPFLSEEVLDWLSLIPREYLCNFQIYRWLFENRIPEWTGVPFNSEMSRYVLSLASVKPVNAQTGVTSPFDFQGFAARNAHSEATRRLGFQGENLSELFAHKGDSLAARLANAMVWYNLQRDFPSDKGELASI